MEPQSLDEFYSGGPKTWQEAFPPFCVKTHWDPTALTNYVLPNAQKQPDLAMDPRPSTRICYVYYNISAGDAPLANPPVDVEPTIPVAYRNNSAVPQRRAPPPVANPVLPPGGAARTGFPFADYNVEAETDVEIRNLPLSRCAERKYLPAGGPQASTSSHDLPGADLSNRSSLSPLLTTVKKTAGCREADDEANWNRSGRLFFNPTRYDRTTMVPSNLKVAQSRTALLCPK